MKKEEYPIKEWDEIAEWFDKKQGEEGDLWHRTLINPGVLRVLGSVSGLDVLDLGCGNGHFARQLARKGARVTGVDHSTIVMRAVAREHANPLGIKYLQADIANLSILGDSTFDVIVSVMVLDDAENAEAAIKESARLLKPGGRLVACISHPCFDLGTQSAWLVEKVVLDSSIWRKVGQRYREVYEDVIDWKISETERWQTRWYHRPMSWYVRAFSEAGLVIVGLEEPLPDEEFVKENPQGSWIRLIPLHCVFDAKKI